MLKLTSLSPCQPIYYLLKVQYVRIQVEHTEQNELILSTECEETTVRMSGQRRLCCVAKMSTGVIVLTD